MTLRFFTPMIAFLLAVSFVVPMTFFVAPRPAHAFGDIVHDPINWIQESLNVKASTISAIQNTLTQINTYTTKWAEWANYIRTWILEPMAFVLSGKLTKALTAGVIAFVIGKSNGTGIPQFVTDVMRTIQTVQDSRALADIKQLSKTDSPFTRSIRASLSRDYLHRSSLKGFWDDNLCTLARSSPTYRPDYLQGNWSHGGIAAWFALTTQAQNNPYTLYQRVQGQVASDIGPGIGGVSGARLANLGWGGGFTSWCGASADAGASCSDNDGNLGTIGSGGTCVVGNIDPTAGTSSTCSDKNGNLGVMSANGCVADTTDTSYVKGINPGDACTQADGSPGVTKTPGSTIKATLDKVLGAQQDQVVRMGNVGPQINSILGNIATVMKTVNFAQEILGGSDSATSGGLAGAGNTSSGRSVSMLAQFSNSQGTLGVTGASIYKSASNLPISGSDMTTRIKNYLAAWTTIKASATSASDALASLAQFCTSAANTAATTMAADGIDRTAFITIARQEAFSAQSAYTSQILPIFTKAATASSTADAALALVAKTQNELNSAGSTDASLVATNDAYTVDYQKLQTMPPTDSDVITAQFDTQATPGVATASPPGGLIVSGGTTIDRMSLIITNAAASKTTVCTDHAYYGGGG